MTEAVQDVTPNGQTGADTGAGQPEPSSSRGAAAERTAEHKPTLVDEFGAPTKEGWRKIGQLFQTPMATRERNGPGGRSFAYVTARQVADRLDKVIGPGNWATSFRVLSVEDHVVECTLSVFGISKADVGYSNNPDSENESEPLKAAYSYAFKRSAVQWFSPVGRMYRTSTLAVHDRTMRVREYLVWCRARNGGIRWRAFGHFREFLVARMDCSCRSRHRGDNGLFVRDQLPAAVYRKQRRLTRIWRSSNSIGHLSTPEPDSVLLLGRSAQLDRIARKDGSFSAACIHRIVHIAPTVRRPSSRRGSLEPPHRACGNGALSQLRNRKPGRRANMPTLRYLNYTRFKPLDLNASGRWPTASALLATNVLVSGSQALNAFATHNIQSNSRRPRLALRGTTLVCITSNSNASKRSAIP